MTPRNLFDLLLLAALWGGSFLFMRYAAPAFGAVPLIWLRVAIAAACLLPLLWWRGQLGILWSRAGAMLVVGVFNSALPFVLFAWALLSISAGLASILNAVTPIFTALIALLWLGERLNKSQAAGLLIGFVGVLLLAADKADFKPGGSGWAIVAMLGATLSYGFVANYMRRTLVGVPSLAAAAGAKLMASLVLSPLAYWFWPAVMPDLKAWLAVVCLGVGSTALAFVLFFRLLTEIGAARAVTVTFLVPVFGVLWGKLFLGETITTPMLLGGAVIVLGTALATGIVRLPAR
ncbi:DMT family transporter [Candidatus Thiothrix sp. Deng01]|uniref:DMT family transporter n=1 Tax=Candidatus Thiothrix phosphatis TaxID=3112415 RepID=A0ABU6CRQ3_9GAMM|nr:DMT family transporter [Candidatus Thiothrix sp. Deng01]MEB4589460.1 DMT family transporter [Candidatus Thiothrix sp. Deng01]